MKITEDIFVKIQTENGIHSFIAIADACRLTKKPAVLRNYISTGRIKSIKFGGTRFLTKRVFYSFVRNHDGIMPDKPISTEQGWEDYYRAIDIEE